MDDIKVLEEIGLDRISQETHIEQKYIQYMIDSEFEKLNRINTLGFIKILSREYNLDLSEWVESFEEYWLENRTDDEEEEIFIVVDANSGSKLKKFLLFLLLIILIIAAIFAYSLYKNQTTQNSAYTPTLTYNTDELIENTKDEIQKHEENTTELALEKELEQNELLATTQDEPVVEEIKEMQEKTEDVIADKNESAVIKEDITEEIIPTQTVNETFENQATITPHTKLWVGVIYLDDFQRRSYLGEGNFSIDLSREQIITTGHGSFDLTGEGIDMKFNRQSPIRFEVKDAKVEEISWSKFKELNKGNSW